MKAFNARLIVLEPRHERSDDEKPQNFIRLIEAIRDASRRI